MIHTRNIKASTIDPAALDFASETHTQSIYSRECNREAETFPHSTYNDALCERFASAHTHARERHLIQHSVKCLLYNDGGIDMVHNISVVVAVV